MFLTVNDKFMEKLSVLHLHAAYITLTKGIWKGLRPSNINCITYKILGLAFLGLFMEFAYFICSFGVRTLFMIDFLRGFLITTTVKLDTALSGYNYE